MIDANFIFEGKECIGKVSAGIEVGAVGDQFKIQGMIYVMDAGIFDVELFDAELHGSTCVGGCFVTCYGIGDGDIKIRGPAFEEDDVSPCIFHVDFADDNFTTPKHRCKINNQSQMRGVDECVVGKGILAHNF